MRRNSAKLLAGPYQRGKIEDAIKAITEIIQHALEAIDRAEMDEGKLKSLGQ